MDYDAFDDEPFCFICNRATDHFAEHDDLVEQGKAMYRRGDVLNERMINTLGFNKTRKS